MHEDNLKNKRKISDAVNSPKRVKNSLLPENEVSANNSNEQHQLISLKGIEKLFNKFEKFYKDNFKSKSRKIEFDGTIQEEIFSPMEKCKSRQKITIAVFGEPGQGKSTLINYLISGQRNTPLPSSEITGRGCTKKPIRCKIWDEEVYKIETLFCNREGPSKELNNVADVKRALDEYMDMDCEEIVVYSPKNVLPKEHHFMENIDFLDLIGMPDKTLDSTRLNRISIERETIDAVFILSRLRADCSVDHIRNMWEIGVFANLKELRPPKIVMVKVVEEHLFLREQLDEILSGFENGTCKQCIIKSLRHQEAFDLPEETEIPEDENEASQLVRPKMPLDIDNKIVVVPELCNRCDAICLRLTNKEDKLVLIQNGKSNGSSEKFKMIIDDIYRHKIDYELRKILDSMLKAITTLLVKVKRAVNSCNKIQIVYHQLFKFLYEQKTYNNFVTKTKRQMSNQLDKIFIAIQNGFEENTMSDEDNYFETSTQLSSSQSQSQSQSPSMRNVFKANQLYDSIIENVTKSLLEIVKNIENKIKVTVEKNNQKIDLELKKEVFSICNEFNLEYFANQLNNKYNNRHSILDLKGLILSVLEDKISLDSFDAQFESFKEKILKMADEIKEDFFIPPTNSNMESYLCDSSKLMYDTLNEIRNEIEQIFKVQNRHYELGDIPEPWKPCRFNKSGSLKLPTLEESMRTNLTIEECLKNQWIKKQYKHDPVTSNCAKELFKEGRIKSELSLKCRPISQKFQHEIESMQIKTAIQIEIDRMNREIVAEFDKPYIDSRINALMRDVEICDGVAKNHSLYPIFMSSRLRGTKSDNVDFYPNLLINKLENGTSLDKFVIFLLIEGGNIGDRTNFKCDIDFYLSYIENILRENETKSNKEIKINPVIVVFLPDRNLGIGRKRKIMMLLAEALKLNRFYFVDDDIDEFYEYDRRAHVRNTRAEPLTTYRALRYMSLVLDYGINSKDDKLTIIPISDDDRRKWIKGFNKIDDDVKESDKETFNELFDTIDRKEYKKRDYIIHLLNNLEHVVPEHLSNEIKSKLYGSHSRLIGTIGLWNQNMNLQRDLLPRLQGHGTDTHAISKVRYQVVIYNLDAMKGIHPVSDKVLFEQPLSSGKKADLCHSAIRKSFKDSNACQAARFGYKSSDKAHVYYQILNGVSGYLLYYYSFRDMLRIPSKVDCDETRSEISDSNE